MFSGRWVRSAIIWAEALIGVRLASHASRAARRLASLEAIRKVTGIEDFIPLVAEHYADIFSKLSSNGRLTASAIGFGVLVGSADEAHFRRVNGLEVRVLVQG